MKDVCVCVCACVNTQCSFKSADFHSSYNLLGVGLNSKIETHPVHSGAAKILGIWQSRPNGYPHFVY